MLCHSVQSKATLQGLESVIGTPGNADEILGGAATVLRINYPMLIFDGLKKTMISLNRNTLGLKMNGKGVKLELMEPSGVELVRTRREPVHRNGKVELAYADVACPMAVYRIQAWRE